MLIHLGLIIQKGQIISIMVSGETLRHYDTLTIDELKEMPVKDIIDLKVGILGEMKLKLLTKI